MWSVATTGIGMLRSAVKNNVFWIMMMTIQCNAFQLLSIFTESKWHWLSELNRILVFLFADHQIRLVEGKNCQHQHKYYFQLFKLQLSSINLGRPNVCALRHWPMASELGVVFDNGERMANPPPDDDDISKSASKKKNHQQRRPHGRGQPRTMSKHWAPGLCLGMEHQSLAFATQCVVFIACHFFFSIIWFIIKHPSIFSHVL